MEENKNVVRLIDVKEFINQIPDVYNDFVVSKYEMTEEYGIFEGIIKIDLNKKRITLPIK